MAYIKETIHNNQVKDTSIDILHPEKNEGFEDYQIMSMSFPFSETMTPQEVRDFAGWLITQSYYVESKYDKKGNPKKKVTPSL